MALLMFVCLWKNINKQTSRDQTNKNNRPFFYRIIIQILNIDIESNVVIIKKIIRWIYKHCVFLYGAKKKENPIVFSPSVCQIK